MLPGAGQTGVALASCVPPTPPQSLPESLQTPIMNFSVLGRVWGSDRFMLQTPTGGCLSCRPPILNKSQLGQPEMLPRAQRTTVCAAKLVGTLSHTEGTHSPQCGRETGTRPRPRQLQKPPSRWVRENEEHSDGLRASKGLPP